MTHAAPHGLTIRSWGPDDADRLWSILEPTFRAGDTYTVDPEISRSEAISYWTAPEKTVFLAEDRTDLLGTYFIRPNQGGGGAHVCNCGYITAPEARGKGVARAMLAHSLEEARRLGYRAMQYNFVIATNTRAIAIWERAGFRTVGRLPDAFRHPREGYVDALVMFRSLV
ncbi:GNAT family N-acetyltransferase [Rhodophyticola porphyridii]|uniref:GNAT family N-acetyltransferase n=1 Tax=Rhodophyticola porphyridii TaxID=1852017 RepID=A0A3L9YIX2_9RHOB|nr:GNAT family N-acetyltransferase [Rhodophyticola porphyridii]RMA42750.1 GNAT family N-acetyltransferase [Rhodophyticola porphyridii]